MITVDGVRITKDMTEILTNWQDTKTAWLDIDIEALENAICFIACEHECPAGHNDKEALMIIADLGVLKKRLKKFAGKEYSNE